MKVYKIILLAVIASLLNSCNAPIVNRALTLPGNLVNSVAGPVLAPLR